MEREAPPELTKAPTKSQEMAMLTKRLAQARDGVIKRERELVDLQQKLAEQERMIKAKVNETGARSQRINVNTLKGVPPVAQVGNEMAAAIRKRNIRRKDQLADRVNKLTSKLGAKLAQNRELKSEIDARRRARLYHMSAVKEGHGIVTAAEGEISTLILEAQRAYAEKETIVLKLGDLKRRANEESFSYVREMDLCEQQVEELEEECKQRDLQVEELVGEVAAANALARQAEEERAAEVERFASVRNQRLALQNDIDRVYDKLHVASFTELIDGYRATASKVLSLWGKQGEQEDELDELTSEIKKLDRETEAANASEQRWRTLAMTRHATKSKSEMAEQDMEHDLEKKEETLAALCKALTSAFASQPLLIAQLPPGAQKGQAITPHTLLQHMGLVESLVVRLVGKKVAQQAAAAKEARLKAEKEAEEAFLLAPAATQNQGGDSAVSARGSESPAAAPAATDAHGRRGRIGVQPPSMSDGGTLHLISDSKLGSAAKHETFAVAQASDSVDFKPLLHGRASLRSELMGQILSGVTNQMDRMAEEERALRSEENKDMGKNSRSGIVGLREPNVITNEMKKNRDASIEAFLARRRGGKPDHGPSFGRSGIVGADALGESVLSLGSSLPPRRVARKKMKGVKGSGPGSAGQDAGLRSNQSAPMLFAANSGREILNKVTRITADAQSSRAFAAEMLPRLPGVGQNTDPASVMPSPSPGYGYGASLFQDGGDLAEPRREIEEINRRLALLEQERLQINQLKHMAIAAGNLQPGGGAGALAPMPVPTTAPPQMQGRGGPLQSSASMGSFAQSPGMMQQPPNSSGGMIGSRSSGVLQPIPRQQRAR